MSQGDKCDDCNGFGSIIVQHYPTGTETEEPCRTCGGSGRK